MKNSELTSGFGSEKLLIQKASMSIEVFCIRSFSVFVSMMAAYLTKENSKKD